MESSTSIVSAGIREEPNRSGGFSRSDSCNSSEDSTAAMRMGACARASSVPLAWPKSANTTTTQRPDARIVKTLGTFIFRARRLSRLFWILFLQLHFEHLLSVLGFLVLEFLENSHGLLCLVHAAKVAVDDSELIPSLLDDFRVGARGCRGTFQERSSSKVISQ